LASTAPVSPLIVTNTNDSGTGSLRAAIEFANANSAEDNIIFNISGTGPHVITLATNLPDITDDDVSIDGITQPGATCGTTTNATGGITDRLLQIIIDGSGLASGDALQFGFMKNPTVRGLVIGGAPSNGLHFDFSEGTATVLCSHLGVNAAGTAAFGNSVSGLRMEISGSGIVGDGTIAGANVISGNTRNGLLYLNTDSGSIRRNFVGVAIDGMSAIPNGRDGLFLADSGYVTPIQVGDTFGGGNIISGNTEDGIDTGNGYWAIYGNYIGTGGDGITPVPNIGRGIEGFADELTIGDGTVDGRNIIAGNGGEGLTLRPPYTTRTIIDGNYIGVSANDMALGNGGAGITFTNWSATNQTTIRNNTIAHNNGDGIETISNATYPIAIYANEIYSNAGLGINLLGGVETNGVTANDKHTGLPYRFF